MISKRSCGFLLLLAVGLFEVAFSQTNEGVNAELPSIPVKVPEAVRRRYRRAVLVGAAETIDDGANDDTAAQKIVTTKIIEEKTLKPTEEIVMPKVIKFVTRRKLTKDNDVKDGDVVDKEVTDVPTVTQVKTEKPVEEKTIIRRIIYKLGEKTLPPTIKEGPVILKEQPKDYKIKILKPVEVKKAETDTNDDSTTETVVTTTKEKTVRPVPADIVKVRVLEVDEAPETTTVIKTRERVEPVPVRKPIPLSEKTSQPKPATLPIALKREVKPISEPAEEPIVQRRSRPQSKESVELENVDVSKSESSSETVITTRERKVTSRNTKNNEDDTERPQVKKVLLGSEKKAQPVALKREVKIVSEQPEESVVVKRVQPATKELETENVDVSVQEKTSQPRPIARPAVLSNNGLPPTPNSVGPLSILKDSFVKSNITPANIFANGVYKTR